VVFATCENALMLARASHALLFASQTIQLCHDIIKTEYAVLVAPAESPTRLKPAMERRSRRKDKAAADDALAMHASENA
jgi:hypothetical protein